MKASFIASNSASGVSKSISVDWTAKPTRKPSEFLKIAPMPVLGIPGFQAASIFSLREPGEEAATC